MPPDKNNKKKLVRPDKVTMIVRVEWVSTPLISERSDDMSLAIKKALDKRFRHEFDVSIDRLAISDIPTKKFFIEAVVEARKNKFHPSNTPAHVILSDYIERYEGSVKNFFQYPHIDKNIVEYFAKDNPDPFIMQLFKWNSTFSVEAWKRIGGKGKLTKKALLALP